MDAILEELITRHRLVKNGLGFCISDNPPSCDALESAIAKRAEQIGTTPDECTKIYEQLHTVH